MPMRVVITGATGNLGAKIRRHLESRPNFELVLIDMDARGDPDVIAADLGYYDKSWVKHFNGADVVVHLAAEGVPHSSWDRLQAPNIDAMLNVYSAATSQGLRRLIFASSNFAMEGYRNKDMIITPELPPRPMTPYGATKVMGERVGKFYSQRYGLSVICFRIGTVQRGENRPGPHMGHWFQQMWLSNRDLCQAVEKAITVHNVRFAVLNLMSNNVGMRWDLTATRRVLGYEPRDCHVPQPVLLRQRLRAGLRLLARRLGLTRDVLSDAVWLPRALRGRLNRESR